MKTTRKRINKDFTIQPSNFMAVNVGSKTAIFPYEIVMIKADTSYSYLFMTDGRKIMVSTNIQKLEERFLHCQSIVRVHRSFLINTQFLKFIDGKNAVLANDIQCVISRRKRNDLFNAIQINNH